MCRLFGYRGQHPTQLSFFLVNASNSLVKQSIIDSRNISNHDGWGIGFYQYSKAYIQKRASAAFNDFNFKQLTEFIQTDTMIAHIREATIGQINDFNTHPFVFQNWIGAHNGTIDAFSQLKPVILKEIGHELALDIKGTTDSEVLFHLFLARLMKKVDNINAPDLDIRIVQDVLIDTLTHLIDLRKTVDSEKPHKLNFLVTNGRLMLASCYGNSLYYAIRKKRIDHNLQLYKNDFKLNLNFKGPAKNESVIIASEELETEDEWIKINDGCVIGVDGKLNLTSACF